MKKLLKVSKKKTLIDVSGSYEHLNLLIADLQMRVQKKYRTELFKALCRDIDFLCCQNITGYRVEIMVEENMNDKMLRMFTNQVKNAKTLL